MTKKFLLVLSCSLSISCSSGVAPRWDEVERSTEYYRMPQRLNGPEPVYGRMTWSHLPEPVVQKNKDDAPLLNPRFSFEMPNSTLEEAVEALAQSLGYRWDYPKKVTGRKVSINMVGTVSEILGEICKQAHVQAEIINDTRVIKVRDAEVTPRL